MVSDSTEAFPVVSIVIVCMNNLKNLYPCLNSIRQYTTVSYETFVVAYLFSKDNLARVRKDFPWVTFIESDEIRGFSENNNLALRQAKGRYCFVLNDDTELNSDVIKGLLDTFNLLNEDKVATLSPMTKYKDGRVQRCGRGKVNLFTWLLARMRLGKKYETHSKYCNKKGIFKTWNIQGAVFLIKTEIFKEVGWFDERYFFCPEDIALSEELNKRGYYCYVNADYYIMHYSGGTWSKLITATRPAATKGEYYFYGGNNVFRQLFFVAMATAFYSMYYLLRKIKYLITHEEKSAIFALSYANAIKTLYTKETPKEAFIKYYNLLKGK